MVTAPELGAIPNSAHGGRALSERRPPPGVSIACPLDKANRGNAEVRDPPLGADGEPPLLRCLARVPGWPTTWINRLTSMSSKTEPGAPAPIAATAEGP